MPTSFRVERWGEKGKMLNTGEGLKGRGRRQTRGKDTHTHAEAKLRTGRDGSRSPLCEIQVSWEGANLLAARRSLSAHTHTHTQLEQLHHSLAALRSCNKSKAGCGKCTPNAGWFCWETFPFRVNLRASQNASFQEKSALRLFFFFKHTSLHRRCYLSFHRCCTLAFHTPLLYLPPPF